MMTENWGFSGNRSGGDNTIDWLENLLIGMAIAKIPAILNTSKTRFLRNVYVNGLFGTQVPGRPDGDGTNARRIFRVMEN